MKKNFLLLQNTLLSWSQSCSEVTCITQYWGPVLNLFLSKISQAISVKHKHCMELVWSTHSSIYCICVCYHQNLMTYKDGFNSRCTYIDLAKVPRTEWPEPNNPKPDPNRHEKELNQFSPEIRNWTNPKSNRPETVMTRIDPKSHMTWIESELTQTLIDPTLTRTRNDPNRIKPEPICIRTDPTRIG